MAMASSPLSSCSFPSSRSRISSYTSSSFRSNSQNSHFLNLKTLVYPIVSTSPKTIKFTPIVLCSSLFSSSSSSSSLRSHGNLRDSVSDSAEQARVEKENRLDQDDVQGIEPDMDELIRVYKGAVLSGDDEATTVIEAKLYTIEKQKNELVHKLLSLQEEMTSGKERYLRLQADFDNFRKRIDKEKLTITSDAKGDVIESLLAMVDSFERARQQIKTETDREEKIDKSYQGIYKQFVEVMRSLNVKAVPAVGKPFDPSIHEAIAREESEEFKVGIVIEEIRRGFLLGNRLLRPATVKVSSGPVKKDVLSEQAVVTGDES